MNLIRRAIPLLVATGIAIAAAIAVGYWTGGSPTLRGSGAAVAGSVGAGAQPTAESTQMQIAVDWEAATLSNGGVVDGYIVRRYDATTDAEATIGSACAGTLTATSCTESAVPLGSWKYTVTPLLATNWRGSEGPRSNAESSTDTIAPTGGSVSYLDGFTKAPSASITFSPGTDSGSGIDPASGILQRATATLGGGSCGSFGSFAVIATNPTSPYSDAPPAGCFKYRYLISDNAGNQATYTSAAVLKVDRTAPTSSLSITNANGAFASSSGTTLYYKGDVAGSFRWLGTVADSESGPASATFPAIATAGWTHPAEVVTTPSGGPYASSTFSWTANPGTPPQQSELAADAAGNATATATSFVSDTTPPAGVSVSYPNGVRNVASVPLTLVNGSDGGSGVDTATTSVMRDVANLNTTTETCGAFPGAYATTVTLVGGDDTSVTSGNCYRYSYTVSDRVGNTATATSPSIAKIDTNGPRVTAIASEQSGGGAGNGLLQNGDRLIVTFNQDLAPASVPSSFSGASESKPLIGNVTLTIPGITNGALDTGSAGYLTLPVVQSFNGTVALNNAGTATTVTITITSNSGLGVPLASSGALVFSPAPAIKDGGGNPAAGTFTTPASFKLF
jgi:hypothetical protein